MDWIEPPPSPEDQIAALGVQFVRAMMASASTDKIRPLDWWPRAKSALVTAADVAESFDHLVSRAGAKLQIEALRKESSSSISSIADEIRNATRQGRFTFQDVRAQWVRDALYLVAIAQVERAEEREEKAR